MTTDIVTIFNDRNNCLTNKAASISLTAKGFKNAREVSEQLIKAIMPLMPASGLAANQIGISKQIFVYSFNRAVENLEIVINPSFEALDSATSWFYEGCFSTMQDNGPCQLPMVERYNKILAKYVNLEGKSVQKILEDYTARIFQHEYDHLQGIVAVNKPSAVVKNFNHKQEMMDFLIDYVKDHEIKRTPPRDF